MKKCLICQQQITKDEDICHSCKIFFKWKYKKDYLKKIKALKAHLEKLPSESTKFCRRYKNE